MTRRSWYRESNTGTKHGEHPVAREASLRLRKHLDHQVLISRILKLAKLLGHLVEGEALQTLLDLEAALNERWLIVAEEYYNLGFEAGMAKRVVDDVLNDAGIDAKTSPVAAIRALAEALTRFASKID